MSAAFSLSATRSRIFTSVVLLEHKIIGKRDLIAQRQLLVWFLETMVGLRRDRRYCAHNDFDCCHPGHPSLQAPRPFSIQRRWLIPLAPVQRWKGTGLRTSRYVQQETPAGSDLRRHPTGVHPPVATPKLHWRAESLKSPALDAIYPKPAVSTRNLAVCVGHLSTCGLVGWIVRRVCGRGAP
jgi:hypothetical protein